MESTDLSSLERVRSRTDIDHIERASLGRSRMNAQYCNEGSNSHDAWIGWTIDGSMGRALARSAAETENSTNSSSRRFIEIDAGMADPR